VSYENNKYVDTPWHCRDRRFLRFSTKHGIRYTRVFRSPQKHGPVTHEWIRDLITVTQKTMLDARKQPGKNYFIGWKNNDDVITEIILFRDHPQPEPEVIVQDYAGLKKAIRQLPSGSFVSYTFSDFRKDLLNYQQIKELHDLCAKNGVYFLLHMGG